MADPQNPQGWDVNKNTGKANATLPAIPPTTPRASDRIDVKIEANYKTGEYTVSGNNSPVYSVGSDGKLTVIDNNKFDRFKDRIGTIKEAVVPKIYQISQVNLNKQELDTLGKTNLYKSEANKASSEAGTNFDQNRARELTNISAKEGKEPRTSYKKGTERNNGLYVYPTGLAKNGQDYIQFHIMKYESKNLTTFFYEKPDYQIENSIGTICLPIQSQISDNNVVNWNEESMNVFEYGAAIASLNMMSGMSPAQITEELIDKFISNTGLSGDFATAFRAYAARMAVSSQGNLLSRLSGAVINPNLELLFQGPLLRVFNFNFRLTPRSQPEADQVRYIIRAFKEASSVQRGTKDLFLKAPNVFKIKYVKGGTTDHHPSLNRIKTCALRSFNVDYTPGGSYSTFNDSNYTMTSYGLQLQFQELEPIYSDDYSTGAESGSGSPVPYNHIGY